MIWIQKVLLEVVKKINEKLLNGESDFAITDANKVNSYVAKYYPDEYKKLSKNK